MTIQALTRHSVDLVKNNSPAILTAFGVAGVAITAYLTAKGQNKATKHVIEKNLERVSAGEELLTLKEKFQLTWKYYVPAALSCGIAIGSVISSQAINSKRNAALFTAVALGETALSEYREKAVELIGKGKEEKLRDAIIQDKVTEKSAEFEKLTLIDTQDQYVYDSFSGRVLVSSVEKLNKAANEVARDCINHDYASLNSFYRRIGLPEIPVGEEVGWNNANPMELNLSSAVVHENKGVLAINYENKPMIGYADIWGSR